jgi:Tetratricopeptide repeat
LPDQAVEDWEIAARCKKTKKKCSLMSGWSCSLDRVTLPVQAIEHYEAALLLSPEDPFIVRNLARLHFKVGNTEAARQVGPCLCNLLLCPALWPAFVSRLCA